MSSQQLQLPTVIRHRHPDRPATVLVVDDDDMVREALAILLSEHGIDVLTAVNGADGLQQFKQHKPDLVLTDIIMPKKEGISLIADLRREYPDAKIVAMSGGGRMGNSDYVTIATVLGANVGLRKPFDDLELIDTIRMLLGATEESTPRASAA